MSTATTAPMASPAPSASRGSVKRTDAPATSLSVHREPGKLCNLLYVS
jgi:hypothetical protein